MAKQTGVLKYSGTLGGIRHYKIKGLKGDFAALAGGPTKEQIKKDPAFKRTRENNMEFAGCAAAGKALRQSMSQVIKTMADSRVTGRLLSVFKQINLNASGVRGQRPILLSMNRDKLKGFNFDKTISFDGVFHAVHEVLPDVSRESLTVSIPDFNASDYVLAPAGATHFRILVMLSVLSDYAYDSATGKYAPVDSELNGLNNLAFSAYLPVTGTVGAVTDVTATLPGSPALTTDVSVVASIGIEFYQEVNGEYYLFAQDNCMKVAEVF